MKKSVLLAIVCLVQFTRASASPELRRTIETFGFTCRNEDPHVIASLLYNQNAKTLEGTVVVGFVHGTLVCPLNVRNKGHNIECFGKYRLPSEDSFVAKLELSRTNQMAKLYLQLPSIETQSNFPVLCFQR